MTPEMLLVESPGSFSYTAPGVRCSLHSTTYLWVVWEMVVLRSEPSSSSTPSANPALLQEGDGLEVVFLWSRWKVGRHVGTSGRSNFF